ncbi:hypothetical protein RJT34_14559 [Clitoria ternatea]|uniref:Uncharacterized protein n=1 Tax=Clitoria ternatea TaxID=43366 RepID=A0AAN9PN02_CLITE
MLYDAGPYKGYVMHVSMVNSLRIGRCDQKEDHASGSEIEAENSPPAAAGGVADPISESADIEFDLFLPLLPPNSSSPSMSIPPELFQFRPSIAQQFILCYVYTHIYNIYALAGICFVVLYVVWLRKCATAYTYSFRSKLESPS